MSPATLVERDRSTAPPSGRANRSWWSAAAIGAWILAIAIVYLWGRWLQARGHRLFINLPPLVGHLDPRLAWQGVGALALAPAAVVWGPRVAERMGWRRLLWVAFAAAAAWALALALTEGVGGVLRSPSSPRDYLHDAPLIGSPLGFLSTYVDRIAAYSTHVRAHPPGMALVAWSLWRFGGGPAWLAGLEIASAASAVPAVLLALRELAGEPRARAAAPFLAFAPAAITAGSSGDAFFAGVGSWAVALLVLSTGRAGRRRDALALEGGVLFGATVFLSYGLVLLAAIPLTTAAWRRRWRPMLLAVVGALPLFVAFLAAGFWWVDGLNVTRAEYAESVARLRPYSYFVVANLVAFSVVLGPAGVAALPRLRGRAAPSVLIGGALVAVLVADLSGMSKAEVERIWLPFVPWLLLATAWLPRASRRGWLAANVAFGLMLELAVRQPW
ncbi:MAG TPA: hypothetical protein VE669_01790 [Actinomycetota bacterium]|nr:hypothetical protein [Actinomycetota bacterium]